MELDRQPYPTLVMRVRNSGDLPAMEVATRVGVGVRGTFVRYLEALAPRERHASSSDIQFRDVEGRYWQRNSDGRLQHLRQCAVYKRDPGAFPETEHPTLHLPESVEERRGYRVE